MGKQNRKLLENLRKYEDDIDRAKCDTEAEALNNSALQNLSVIVNGERYKII